MAQRLGEMTFADAHRACEDDGLVAAEKAAGGQFADRGGGNLGVIVEVERGERLDLVEACRGHAPRHGVLVPPLDLIGAETLQEVDVTEAVGFGLMTADVQGIQHAASRQPRPQRAQLVRVHGNLL